MPGAQKRSVAGLAEDVGLSYGEAETKLLDSNLNTRLLATRYDLSLQPGLIIDQVPQPATHVDGGYLLASLLSKACDTTNASGY